MDTSGRRGDAGRHPFAPWADPAAQPLVRFERVAKRFAGHVALDDLSLDIFEGYWDTRVTIIGDRTDFGATDIYEWMPGGFFMLHNVEAQMGGQEVRTLEVIGAHPQTDGYLSWSFDNAGGAATYTAALRGRNSRIPIAFRARTN